MKDKILNAIDKGLMNVLSTDIEDQDIDFDTNDIDNEYIPEISLDELYGMFKKDHESLFGKRNTKNAVSLILDCNVEISLYQYDNGMNPKFIKISNDELQKNNSEILIYIPDNHLISEKLMWQTEVKQIQDYKYLINSMKYKNMETNIAVSDLNGYVNCQRISEIQKENRNLGGIPAIKHCALQNIHGYIGYLPSMGQLKIISDYLDLINYVLEKIGADKLVISTLWSSTEHSVRGAWYLRYGMACSIIKNNYSMALPIFRKNNLF